MDRDKYVKHNKDVSYSLVPMQALPLLFINKNHVYNTKRKRRAWGDKAILATCIAIVHLYFVMQTLTISTESVVPQLSMNFTTSDVNTPGNIIQLEELISVNVSITLPEVRPFLQQLAYTDHIMFPRFRAWYLL